MRLCAESMADVPIFKTPDGLVNSEMSYEGPILERPSGSEIGAVLADTQGSRAERGTGRVKPRSKSSGIYVVTEQQGVTHPVDNGAIAEADTEAATMLGGKVAGG